MTDAPPVLSVTNSPTPGRGRQVLYAVAATLLSGLNPLSAQEYLSLRQGQEPTPFSYDARSEYVRLTLKDLNLPRSTRDNSAIGRFFRDILIGREREFAIATLAIDFGDGPTRQRVLYSIEKDGGNYNVSTLAGGPAARHRMTDGFVFDQSLPVTITVTRSEWEEREDILSAAASKASGLLGTGAAAVSDAASTMFDAILTLVPPTSTVTGMSATIAPDDLTSAELIIGSARSTNNADLFTLEFEILDGHFHDYDLPLGLLRAGLSEAVDSWREMIREADTQIVSDGLGPLEAALLAFSDYVGELPLTRNDRAILTACAIKDWAPGAYRGTLVNGREVQFSANRYLRLATSNLEAIRGSACDMPQQIECNTEECRSVADFLVKSARQNGRRSAAELYIDEFITLIAEGQEIDVSSDEYIEGFRIRRSAHFDKQARVAGRQWSFVFEAGTLDMSYKGEDYSESEIVIDVSRADTNGETRYYVTGIETR